MGFLTRALVPRGVRRAAHPVRTAKSAVTPNVVKQARRLADPAYGIERALNTKPRKRRTAGSRSRPVKWALVALPVIVALVFGWQWLWLGFVISIVLMVAVSGEEK